MSEFILLMPSGLLLFLECSVDNLLCAVGTFVGDSGGCSCACGSALSNDCSNGKGLILIGGGSVLIFRFIFHQLC